MTAALTGAVAVAVVVTAVIVTWWLRRDEPGVDSPAPKAAKDVELDALERAALRPDASLTAEKLVGLAGASLADLPGIDLCRFESFPFSSALPRVARGVVQFPADEPGMASLSAWHPAGGVEVGVCANGLPLGRFVLIGPAVTDPATMPPSVNSEIVSIADRLSAALTALITLDPVTDLPRGGTTWRTSCSSPS